MDQFQGKTICGGVAIGPLKAYFKKRALVEKQSVLNTAEQIRRFDEARQIAARELNRLQEKAMSEAGKAACAVFEAYQVLLSDEEYINDVYQNICENSVTAEYAISRTSAALEKRFLSIDDPYIKARASDVTDISDRLIGILCGKVKQAPAENSLKEPVILFAEELSPSDMMQLGSKHLLGLITGKGSANSHTAIIAKSMDLPYLTGIDLMPSLDGVMAILDGESSRLLTDPDASTLKSMGEKQDREREEKRLLSDFKGIETVTKDGKKIRLYANISDEEQTETALLNDAEGIGLFRTEFLFLGAEKPPTLEEQLTVYRNVLEKMKGREVVIRTLDIGADKMPSYFEAEKEENAAMGLRGIRFCRAHEEVFVTQMTALYRASVSGQLSVLFPMIISAEEVAWIRRTCQSIEEDLQQKGIAYQKPKLGIMIETPAAAMISDKLAKEVDFFSIGTNDLTQYTLAIDRQSTHLDAFYDPHHEAVLRLIRMVIENAHAEGCSVGICGELGGDPQMTEFFLKAGIDELSVTPSMILPLRKRIRESNAFN
ncbi:MAG: phosphoenolpyruvate--protein phosphotransferase [Lachnospiraceae bacterium]|nr:phosphoenolpyruvate--protein phosphotransferase [Lachnospiraceae bacterium]